MAHHIYGRTLHCSIQQSSPIYPKDFPKNGYNNNVDTLGYVSRQLEIQWKLTLVRHTENQNNHYARQVCVICAVFYSYLYAQ